MTGMQAVRIVGGIVPPSFLARVQAGEVDRASLSPSSYRLAGNETLRDAAARAWTYLRGAWAAWHELEAPGAGATRDRWLLPLLRELGYGNVPSLSHGLNVDGASFPISHCWEHVPLHLLSPGVGLDRRNPGVAGAARAAQAMLQEFLNRSGAHLWAILSNGSKLRLLRDSTALAGSAYLEFDLDAIFDGELYSEFLLLFLVAHSTRLEKRSGTESGPADCWIEAWRNEAVETGTRALDRLRAGVEEALIQLGDGFLHHPANGWLVDALRTGELTDREYLRALLRLVYRLLFVFVAEDRHALLDPEAAASAKSTYADYFSTARLRRLSRIRSGGPHEDLWRAQRLVLEALGGQGLSQVAVPALGGLFDPDSREERVTAQPGPDLLLAAQLSNHSLLSAVRALAWVEVKGGRTQSVDYRNLGAEELGSVYESLLELVPRVDLSDMTFRLETTAGNDRKTTGSYYTPPALVSALLDTALDPLLDEAVKEATSPEDAESRLLSVTVCDPACGSGGFLVAAARRIARRLAQVRSGEDEPTPEAVHQALRDVVGRCIYGVDLNDLAAELAKVSLWLEAMQPCKPLGFLDARIRVGNSLLGATPALLAEGIPDEAFKEIEGDDKKWAAVVRKQNKAERAGQSTLFTLDSEITVHDLMQKREGLLATTDDVEVARRQAQDWEQYVSSVAVRHARLVADAWCSAFIWPLTADSVPPVTEDVFRHIVATPNSPSCASQVAEVERIAHEHRFFHWHLEFPEVFSNADGAAPPSGATPGGFSCLVGNPPWDQVQLDPGEYFSSVLPEITNAPTKAAKDKLLSQLKTREPVHYEAFTAARRLNDGQKAFIHRSGCFPLTSFGRLNTYSLFAELFRRLVGHHGMAAAIVPTGIATDSFNQFFFKELVSSGALISLYDFENRLGIFPSVHSGMKFCLLTIGGRDKASEAASFAFFLHRVDQIEAHAFNLSPHEIALLNPNTGTCPVFRTRRDAEITLGLYRAHPIMERDHDSQGGPHANPWEVRFSLMFMMNSASGLFRDEQALVEEGWTRSGNRFTLGGRTMVPLYEAKMVAAYDHRSADVVKSATASKRQNQPRYLDAEQHSDSLRSAMPLSWVAEEELPETAGWLAGFADVTSPTNERTVVAAAIPRSAVGHTFPVFTSVDSPFMLGMMNSFVFDYVARQKVAGLHLTFGIVKQLPVLEPEVLSVPAPWCPDRTLGSWVNSHVLELSYTAWDLAPLACDLQDTGTDGRARPPFIWDSQRRFMLRAELDAAFFHLYGLERVDVAYIMDTFPIVRRKDEAAHGEYRTKRVILELFDAMTFAIESGVPYETPIDPPPGQGPRHSGTRS